MSQESDHASSNSSGTRRMFLQASGAAVVGASLGRESTATAAGASKEQLALFGGSKAVTVSGGNASKWPLYGETEERAVLALLRKPNYNPIAALERDWKQSFGFKYAKAHCNGTSALTSMFFALDLPPGSEILVPSYTFFATIVPMRNFGLVPVFVDIDPRTLNFDLQDAKRRLTKNTRAVLPVHWFGLPCDMDQISDWADQKGLIVIEDAAHAHGAKLQDKFMGKWGRMAIFSYQMSKPMPAMEGGMGVYSQQDDFDRATAFGHYNLCRGKYAKYRGTGLGLKLRMHPMAAALARCQLNKLPERNASGTKQTRRLNDRLIQLPGLYDQKTRPDCERLYYGVNVLFIDEKKSGMSRSKCVKALRAEGVQAGAYTYPLQHEMTLYSDAKWWHHKPAIPQLPGSAQANATAISLPYFTSHQPELVDQYIRAFEKVWAHRKDLA
jgi:perosamine synthetase